MIINNWNTYLKSIHAAPGAIHNIISKRVQDNDLFLPDFRNSNEILIFSDYGGEHKESRFTSYSFLITTPFDVQGMFPYIERLRQKYSTIGRVMNYKNLRDKLRLQALPEYLHHYNYLNGIMLNVIVDKHNLTSIFMQNGFDLNSEELKDFEGYKKGVFEKTIRIIHFLSLLINGICAPDQDIYWITDDDEIIANDKILSKMSSIFRDIIRNYVDFQLGELVISPLSLNEDPHKIIEEFCGIPDLAAGVLPNLQDHLADYTSTFEKNQFVLYEGKLSQKDSILGGWLSENNNKLPLKNIQFMISGYGEHMLVNSLKIKVIKK